METEKQNKKQNKNPWLDPYKFKAGQSGNPEGRPPGKSLKTWVREYFEQLPDEDKMAFLNKIDPELAWRMAEGNPDAKTDITTGGEKFNPILVKFIDEPENNINSEGVSETV